MKRAKPLPTKKRPMSELSDVVEVCSGSEAVASAAGAEELPPDVVLAGCGTQAANRRQSRQTTVVWLHASAVAAQVPIIRW